MKSFSVLLASLVAILPLVASANPPNILWVDIDDQSPWYGAYGDDTVSTPNLDALASQGVIFTRAYAAAPVCAPSRSAMVTGVYPIRVGTHDMRSGRVPGYQIILPDEITTVPELLRSAGYETYNAHKDDYNFSYDRRDLYSIGNPANPYSPGHPDSKETSSKNYKGLRGTGSWRDVAEGPFFGQMSIPGGKSVEDIDNELRALGLEPVDPASVRVPAQYPDIPQVRQHVADHYNSILRTDHRVGELLQQFKDEGLWGNTVFILYSDHGSDLPRSKNFVYSEGLHIPFIIAAPGMDIIEPGRRDDLVNLMDIAATTLGLAGIDTPQFMDARDVFAEDYHREYVFSSADRMSNTIDRTRSAMGDRFHYIRNFMLDRPLFNWNVFEIIAKIRDPDGKTTSLMAMRRMAEAGELSGAQMAPYGKRVAEELYDLQNDPDEVNNLAADPAYKEQLAKMRTALSGWIADTDDKGQYPRSQAAMDEVLGRFPPEWLHGPEFQNEPTAARYPEHIYFGDTHVHTTLSADAYGMGTRLMPEQAYRFAKGEAVIATGGQTAQLRRPLDFLLVADHAENLGVIQAIHNNDPALPDSDNKQRRAKILNSTPPLSDVLNAPTFEEYKAGSHALLSAKAAKEGEFDTPLAFRRSVWQSVVAIAERHNDPGTFTTFVGFEWSASDPGPIHRNVLFADGPERTGRILPFSAYDSPDVEDLWAYLEDYEHTLLGRALAIPHNGNLSRGGTFALRTYQGEPLSEDYATRRAHWEPLYEVTQIKGDGETHPRLSSADEFADFETWPPVLVSKQVAEHRKKDDASAKKTAAEPEPDLQASYARSALKNGLTLQVELGANPFKFGMIGSTDSHNGLATADSDNFWGKMAFNEPSPYRAIDQWYYTASGYAAVWAQENTRDSLFAAMRRKETYATTGPRMVVRFFGGWDYEAADADSADLAEIGYAKGVPMGGDLNRSESGKAPRFLIAAAKDPDGANLDRIQIIKGWRDGDGELHEKVIDVALSDGRQTAAGGSAELATVWTDPDFDADNPAFYYLRVLEIPTPRWTAYDAKTYRLKDLPKELPMVLQERAYTAPIWYTP